MFVTEKRKTKLIDKQCLLIIVTEVCAHQILSYFQVTKTCLDHQTIKKGPTLYWGKAWKTILNKYSGLNFFLKCNYNEKFLRRTNLAQFYKSMLQHFLELKVAYKEILIENHTIFYKELFQKGIFPCSGSFTGKWPASYISGVQAIF